MREMKDSGVQWIGEIPAPWSTARVKNVAKAMQSGGTPDSSNDRFYVDMEVGIPWVAIGDMSTTPYVRTTTKYISEEARLSKNLVVFNPGTILYAMYASVGKVAELTIPATINQALLAIELNSTANSAFFKYSLNAWEPYIISESNGTTQFNLNANKVANLCFPFPCVDEQKRIADYLDRKCSQVDTLIANVQAQIEKLKAYKQSLITEVVTKGLDPTVPMKDSGVEWIGEIPGHWEITRIKNLFELRNERNNEADLSKVNLISLYTDLGVVQHSDIIETTGNRAVTADGYKFVHEKDIVVNIILCWMGAVGMSKYDGVTSPAYDIYRPLDGTISEYYHYLFRTSRFNGECYRYGRGIMMMRWRTYSAEFRAINVPCPSKDEQERIVAYLNDKSGQIDHLIALKQSKIEKLEQYKKSLIYEYVTGKKEVKFA